MNIVCFSFSDGLVGKALRFYRSSISVSSRILGAIFTFKSKPWICASRNGGLQTRKDRNLLFKSETARSYAVGTKVEDVNSELVFVALPWSVRIAGSRLWLRVEVVATFLPDSVNTAVSRRYFFDSLSFSNSQVLVKLCGLQ